MNRLPNLLRVLSAQQRLYEIAENASLTRAMLALAVFGPLFDVMELDWWRADND